MTDNGLETDTIELEEEGEARAYFQESMEKGIPIFGEYFTRLLVLAQIRMDYGKEMRDLIAAENPEK